MKYYCKHCFYVYDEALGEPDCGISPGTPFLKTPSDYECPLCHNYKGSFVKNPEVRRNPPQQSSQRPLL